MVGKVTQPPDGDERADVVGVYGAELVPLVYRTREWLLAEYGQLPDYLPPGELLQKVRLRVVVGFVS